MSPSPAIPGVSSLPLHSICMPRQTPSRGVPLATAAVIAWSSPPLRSAAIPAPNAPTPGSTTRPASRTSCGSLVTVTLAPSRRNALVIEARFATPESTITTSAIECPLGGRHVGVAGAGDCLLQRERRCLERGLRLVMIVLALEHVDVQGEPRRDGERTQHMRDVLAREPPDAVPPEVERHVSIGAPRQVHDGARQGFVERGEGRSEPRHAPALAQRAVERLPQRQRAILGGVVIIDVEVALAGERQVQPGVAAQRVQQMVEEADARLHVDATGAVQGERHGDGRLARGARDGCGAGRHGRSPPAASAASSASHNRSKSAGSPGNVIRSDVSRPGRPGKSRTTTPRPASAVRIAWARAPHSTSTKFACEGWGASPRAASRVASRPRSTRMRATWVRSGSTPRSSCARASAIDGAATEYGPPAARSTPITYGLPTA